jgi:hypothetical protein
MQSIYQVTYYPSAFCAADTHDDGRRPAGVGCKSGDMHAHRPEKALWLTAGLTTLVCLSYVSEL